MGCCNSKNDIDQEEGYIPRATINQNNNQNNISITPNSNPQQQSIPPIVITKANSINSANSSSLPPSTSTHPIPQDVKTSIQQQQEEEIDNEKLDKKESEKPPAIMEEYNEPPAFEEESKPMAIIPPAVEVTTETVSSSKQQETWTILVRRTNAPTKDIMIDIPTSEPFMTVFDLKKSDKLQIEADQRIRFIYLGRILEDQSRLVPSSSSSSLPPQPFIKIANHGVIQAMIYKK